MVRVLSSDSNYSNSAIQKRTGLSRSEVEQVKSEGKREIEERGDYGDRGGVKFGNSVGSFGIGKNKRGETGTSIGFGGAGVEWGERGSSISLPGGIKIETVEQGCYIVQRHSIFGQETFTNVKKKPECDDNDDDSNNNEPKPPNCIGSNGKPGTGEPKNLLPECTNDGKVHLYHILVNFYEEQEIIYSRLPDSNIARSRESRNKFLDETMFEHKAIQNQTGTVEQIQSETYPVSFTEYFNGTYIGLLEYLSIRVVIGQFGKIADKLPDSKSSESSPEQRYINGVLTDVITKQKSWAYAIVISVGSGCNPTGNEGCEDKPKIGDGTSDDTKPFPTGLPTREKNDTLKRREMRDYELMDRCCANTKKIAQALAVDEILDKGLIIPGRLVAYGAKKKITMKSYLEIMENHFRVADNLGIHPIEVKLQDSNNSLEGDQTYEVTFINATASIKQLLELGLEGKGQQADRLGILFRIAWINVQILSSIVAVVRGVQGLMQFLGVPIREKQEKVWMPFDVTLGKRDKIAKGFGNKNGKKPTDEEIKKVMDLRDEDSMEDVLPQFLNATEQPVLIETFDDKSSANFFDILRQVIRR